MGGWFGLGRMVLVDYGISLMETDKDFTTAKQTHSSGSGVVGRAGSQNICVW